MSSTKCRNINVNLDPIPDALEDKSLKLYPNHNVLTHTFCVLLRILIGLALIGSTSKCSEWIIVIILLLAIVVFGAKLCHSINKNIKLWKFYPRMILSYATALYLIKKQKRNDLAGLLVIVDTLIAYQSRHTISVSSCS